MIRPFLSVLVLIQAAFARPLASFVVRRQFRFRPPICRVSLGLAARYDDDSSKITTRPDRPIVVFGAGGKTGTIITQVLAEQQQYVHAVDRHWKTPANVSKEALAEQYISYTEGDVTCYDSVLRIIQQGAAGVIWAATSSGVKQGGGDVVQVDYKGAYYTAKACLECDVPKLAFISAGCVTRSTSLGSRAVNRMARLS